MNSKTLMLADAMTEPFHPDELAERFNIDRIAMRTTCCYFRAHGHATARTRKNRMIYELTEPIAAYLLAELILSGEAVRMLGNATDD